MRAAVQELRELIRKNTLGQHNKCDFDMTPEDKIRAQVEKEMKKKSSPKKPA